MNNNNVNMGNLPNAYTSRPQNIQGSANNPHPKYTYKNTFVKRSTPEEEAEAVRWGWKKTGRKSRGQNIWEEPILNPEWIAFETKKKKYNIYLTRKAAAEVKKTIEDLVKKVTNITEQEADRLARAELNSIKEVMRNSGVGGLSKHEEETRLAYLKTQKMLMLQPQLEEQVRMARESSAAAEEQKRLNEQAAKAEKNEKRLAAAAARTAKKGVKTAKKTGATNATAEAAAPGTTANQNQMMNDNINLGGGRRRNRKTRRRN